MNYSTTLLEHWALFWRLKNGTKISDTKIVWKNLKLFLWRGQLRKSSRKSNRCHSICTHLRTPMPLRECSGSGGPEMCQKLFDCLNLKEARTRILFVIGPPTGWNFGFSPGSWLRWETFHQRRKWPSSRHCLDLCLAVQRNTATNLRYDAQ